MATATELKDLPAPARRLITRLETQLTKLSGQVEVLRVQLVRQGYGVTVTDVSNDEQLVPAVAGEGKPKRAAYGAASTVEELRTVLKSRTPLSPTGLEGAQVRGEAAKVLWIQTGEMVPAKALADAWDLSPQALGPAEDRQEVFSLMHKRKRFYPAEFLALDREVVAEVNQALGKLPAKEKLVFWKRPHGALGGATVSKTLATPGTHQFSKVVTLAQSWAQQAATDAAARA